MLTGLLGNLSLMSYFARKRETEAVVVQSLGCISTYVVIAQLAIAEAMPLPQFIATTAVVATGLTLNFLNYIRWLPEGAWLLWEDFMTIGGLAVLPQVTVAFCAVPSRADPSDAPAVPSNVDDQCDLWLFLSPSQW